MIRRPIKRFKFKQTKTEPTHLKITVPEDEMKYTIGMEPVPTEVLKTFLNAMFITSYTLYGQKYWWELNLLSATVLVDFNLAVALADRPTAKFNSPLNFLVIQYGTILTTIQLHRFVLLISIFGKRV